LAALVEGKSPRQSGEPRPSGRHRRMANPAPASGRAAIDPAAQ
jgi:hypothetical protein